MKTITIEEYVKNSDSIIKRVEQGEKIAVTDGQIQAVLVPSDEYVRLHTMGGSAETWHTLINPLYFYCQPNKAMTLTSKFKKDLRTLESAVRKEIYLDVKNPKLYKKVKKYYKNVEMIEFTGEPLDDYDILMDVMAEDLKVLT